MLYSKSVTASLQIISDTIRTNSAKTPFHGRYELIVLTYKVKPQYSPGKIQLKGSASFVDCRN